MHSLCFIKKVISRQNIIMVVFNLLFIVILKTEASEEHGNPLLSLFILGYLLLISMGAGDIVINYFSIPFLSKIEKTSITVATGLGLVAYYLFLLGILGQLKQSGILLSLFFFGLLSWKKIIRLSTYLPKNWKYVFKSYSRLKIIQRLILDSGMFILFLSVLQTLTPPWDYDGLMYHLEIPQYFIDKGQIIERTSNWLSYYPLTGEMLFIIGLIFKDDSVPRLIHLLISVLLVLATFSLGRRYVGDLGGWIAAGMLVTIPIFNIWASAANVDMAWALYEMLSIYLILLWKDTKHPSLLILSGIMVGFALGIKYLAFSTAIAIGIWIIILSRKEGIVKILKYVLVLAGFAFLVASPWYVKNFFWTGNPIYPFFFKTLDWPGERLNLWVAYMNSYGTGKSIVDLLLLPINIYKENLRFSTFMGSLEFPSILFPIIIFYPFLKKSTPINNLLLYVLIRLIIWILGSQQIRFLLPIFPIFSVLTSYVLSVIPPYIRIRRILIKGFMICTVIGGIASAVYFFLYTQPVKIILQQESRQDFLARVYPNINAINYINEELPLESRVLLMWDGRGYYCNERCLPDFDQMQWTWLTMNASSSQALFEELSKMNITHIMYSKEDVEWFLHHDPTGQHRNALLFWEEQFKQACTRKIFEDTNVQLFTLICRKGEESFGW